MQTPAVKMEKAEAPPRVAAIPKQQNNRPVEEKCTWELYCSICKKEEGSDDWNGDRQENQQRNHYPQNPQHPKHMMSLRGIQSNSGHEEKGMRRWSI